VEAAARRRRKRRLESTEREAKRRLDIIAAPKPAAENCSSVAEDG